MGEATGSNPVSPTKIIMNKQINNGVKLFQYLEQLSLLNTNVRKNIKVLFNGEERFDLEDENFLPELDKIFLKK